MLTEVLSTGVVELRLRPRLRSVARLERPGSQPRLSAQITGSSGSQSEQTAFPVSVWRLQITSIKGNASLA